ncbi:MAG: TrkA family potassium uptake protein [Haloarculaceae archaeon]
MDSWQRRTARYLLLLVAVVVGYAVLYDLGMGVFEGRPQSFLHSLQVVVETFTTTGFGSDAPWTSPQMNALIIVMDLTGVALIFLALPVLVFPLFEDALSTTVPTAADLADHVIVCTLTQRAETLIAELDSWGVPYVVVEPDREVAIRLYEDGYDVVHAEPDSVADLEAVNVGAARALVADVSDRVDASIVLAAREAAADTRVVSVVEDPDRATYHELAGADAVLSPRPLLGESLARKVTTAVTTDLGDAVAVGQDFDIAELPVHRASDLAGTTLADSGLRERAGVNVIGGWFDGQFESPLPPERPLEAGTILLVSGRETQLERLKELTVAPLRQHARGTTVVVGYGEVGRTVVDNLASADLPYTVVDRREAPGVDVVGDATDPDVLRAAGVPEARSVILALPDDTDAEFATLVARDLAPDVEIIARATEPEAVRKLYRAGADYALALATISGRLIASAVLDEEVMAMDTQVEVVRTAAPGLAGQTLAEADVRDRTGCTVVAVERDGRVLTDLGPTFRIEDGDEVIVAGTDAGVNRFTELLG